MADVITLIVDAVTLYLVNLIVGIVVPYLVGKVAPAWVGEVAPILVGLFAAVSPYLLDPIGREMFNYHSNIKKLSEEVNKLQAKKADWTNADEIDEIIKNALKFLEDEKKENEGFFNRLCAWLNLKSWYQKSRKAKQTAAEIVSKIQEGYQLPSSEIVPKIQEGYQLSSSCPPRKIRIPSVEGYEAFESRTPILKKIMESLSNANVNLIGVWGMGGTGKTMLVKEIGRKCEEDKLFDEVVIATVSQPLNIRKIQGEIADKLTLTLKEETDSGRAGRLCEELKKLLVDKKQSILVILDDIWEKLNLAEVGIPFGDNYRGCKVVMTSRNRDVLSNGMRTQETCSIDVLQEEEAWDLFKKIAGDSIEDHDRKPIARGIVEECARLPIAIVTVANALKNKGVPIWKDALRELRSTPTSIEGMQHKGYSALRWSYDFLEDEKEKSLFLLCSLLPEDYQFSILDILKFGEGVDLFQGINLLEDARNKVDKLLNTLTDSSLLLDDNTTRFRMHDIVRDVGIYVASNDKHMLIVRNDDEMEEQMRKEKLKDCPAISLPCSGIHELPTGLECPKLTLCLFFSNDRSLKIPDTFFERMEQLRVLNFRNMCFPSLPSSLRDHFLSNLRTLCLDHCVFRDIPRQDLARIGELKKLEVLSFASSDIAELPREIGQLTCLRLLDLTNCSKLNVILPNVIAKLTRLEDLYMAKSFDRWEVDGNASLAELKDLSQLVTLDIHIPDTNILPKDLRFENLMRYKIFIGDGWDWYGDCKTSRTLKLKLNTSIQEFGLYTLLERTEDLYLGEMNGIKNGLCNLNREGFPHLRHLHVQNGCEMEYVVNTLELIPDKAFPELRSLFLYNLIYLKKIFHGQLPTESFCKLRIVKVQCCDALKNLFPLSVVKGLLQLRTLKVNECKIMDEIVSEASEGSEGNNEAMGKITFPQLRSLELYMLPKLSSFYSKKQTSRPFNNYAPTTNAGSGEIISKDEHDIPVLLFNEKVAFPNLEKLVIENVNSLKEIWPSQLPVDDDSFCKLQSLRVRSCEHLLNIVPYNMLMRLQNMEILTVSNCGGSLEYIFDLGGLNDQGRHVELRDLELEEIPGLKQIWKKDPQTNFLCQKLSSLEVSGCGNLRIIFTTSMVKSLKQLQKLSIRECKMVEEIVEEEGVEEQAIDKIEFPELTSLTLGFLPQLKSFCQGSCTLGTPTNQPLFLVDKVAFPNLEVLSIKKVNSLKEIWPSQLPVKDDSFCNLKSFRVQGCEHLLNIIPSNMLMRLRNLESLEVAWGIRSVEYIFDVRELNDMERHVPSSIPLRKLSLSGCPRLKQIWKTDSQLSGYFPFQNLTSLEVRSCSDLRHIFTTSIVKSLEQLQQLKIMFCEMVEEIVGNEGVEEESMGKIEFPRLTSLTLGFLPQLKSFYQGIFKVETFSLESSNFEESHRKGHVDTPTKPLFLADKVAFPDLEKLKLTSMSSMKEIWQDQYQAASFGKLRVLEVRNCKSLTHVLTFAIAKSLVQIKSIIVDDCKMMKEVIASEEGEETDETIFSQLNSLKLRNLPNLTSFCTRSNTFSFPSLEEVLVEKCTELKNFFDGILHTPKLDKVHVQSKSNDLWEDVEVLDKGFWKGDLNTTIQYLFVQKMEFLRLFELSELKQICHDQFSVGACYVRYLVVENCSSLLNVVSSNMLESLPKLEKITVESCDSLEQVFDLEGIDCDEMIQELFWDKKHAGLLPDLEEMNLTELPKLRCIWNKDPKGILTFRHLRRLKIHKCNSLRNLFSPSMVPYLWELDSLEITDCLNMEEIVEKEKGAKEEAKDMVMYFCTSIILQGLPNLTSFYPGNRTLWCPWLNTMKIAGCPRIKTIFTSTNEGLQETFGDGNNDVPSAALFNNNKVEFPRLKELELEDLYNLKELWQGQLHAESFCKLTTLTVRSCQSLAHLLPFEITKSLVQIKSITVDSCEMMKEIIAREEGEEADHETTFSQLSSLKLRSLPNLTNFCTGSNTISFPSLEQVLVEECPKLKTFSNGILNTTKLEKVQVQEDEWVWKDDLNTTIQHLFAQKGDHL